MSRVGQLCFLRRAPARQARVRAGRESVGLIRTGLFIEVPSAIAVRTGLGKGVRRRTNRYLNNRLEQDHRGTNGRDRPMRGLKSPDSAARFGRGCDDHRNFLHIGSRRDRHLPTSSRGHRFLTGGVIALRIPEAARTTDVPLPDNREQRHDH